MRSETGKAVIIGGGYLGSRLAERLSVQYSLHIISRTKSMQESFHKKGWKHSALDIRNSTFFFDFSDAEIVIWNAAVTVDKPQENAKFRLYRHGLENVFRNLKSTGFKGKFIIVGSTGAVTLLEDGPIKGRIDEKTFLAGERDNGSPAYQQFAVWKELNTHQTFPSIFVASSGIYGPFRHPGNRIKKGLRQVGKDPRQLVNLVHVNDLVGIITYLTKTASEPDFIFASDGHPMPLQEYYGLDSKLMNLPEVHFTPLPDAMPSNRHIDNTKIKALGYEFLFPTYEEGIPGVIAMEEQNKSISKESQ